MANRIKKNNDQFNIDKTLNKINVGNWTVGLNADGDGPTADTLYYNGVQIPAGGFAIYSDSNDPTINARIASNLNELPNVLTAMGYEDSDNVEGSNQIGESLAWAKASDILVLNNSIDLTNTVDLVTYLDAKHVGSYPGVGSVWYSLHNDVIMGNIKTLGFSQHSTARPIFEYFAKNSQMTELNSIDELYEMSVAEIKAGYDLVVVDSYVWSFNNTTMTKLKELVDAGVSCIGAGNDNRTNIFVHKYDTTGHSSHSIQIEADSKIGLSSETFTYGSGDVYGGISELKNGAVPVYRRADNNLITGFVYDNYNTGASLFFDQEGLSTVNTEVLRAGVEYVLKHIGSKANFINTPTFDAPSKSFKFEAASTWFDLSKTAVEDLSASYTLSGFCKQGNTGAPHQTLIGTASNYRSGGKLMSRYHGPAAFWVGNSDGSDSHLLSSSVDITGGGWHHLAATRNHTNGMIQIYVDGKLKNQEELGGLYTGTMSMVGTAAVGMDYHSSSYNHTGQIQTAKAWQSVLTADQILQEYYGANIHVSTRPSIFMDPANLKTYDFEGSLNFVEEDTTNIKHITDLEEGRVFEIESSTVGFQAEYADENNGILRLDGGKLYTQNIGWFGKMSISWWMKSNSNLETGAFYTESYRGSGGCSRISSTILTGGRFNFSVWDNSSSGAGLGGSHNVVSTSSVMDGKWHQVTCQWSNGTGSIGQGIYVYVDGQLEGHNAIPLGNDGAYQYLHLGGVSGCVGTKQFDVDFGPIIHYKNHNLTNDEVYQNYAAHANRYK